MMRHVVSVSLSLALLIAIFAPDSTSTSAELHPVLSCKPLNAKCEHNAECCSHNCGYHSCVTK